MFWIRRKKIYAVEVDDPNLKIALSFVLQYGEQFTTLIDPPENPKAKNILDVLRQIKTKGYEIQRIQVSPVGREKREFTDISEDELLRNPDLEYTDITLLFNENPAGIHYLVLGKMPPSKKTTIYDKQFAFQVTYDKIRNGNGVIKQLENIIENYAFDNKNVRISPLNTSLFLKQHPLLL